MAFVPREVQAPTNQPRQSCQGSQRLGYHLFGSSTGTSCWCEVLQNGRGLCVFHREKKGGLHPVFTHGPYEKSSCLTIFQYSRFAKNTLAWWFFCLHPRRLIPLGFWNLFGTFCYPPGNCPRSDDFPAFPFGGIWTRFLQGKQIPSINVPCFLSPVLQNLPGKNCTSGNSPDYTQRKTNMAMEERDFLKMYSISLWKIYGCSIILHSLVCSEQGVGNLSVSFCFRFSRWRYDH